jgi:hypothetical protein
VQDHRDPVDDADEAAVDERKDDPEERGLRSRPDPVDARHAPVKAQEMQRPGA